MPRPRPSTALDTLRVIDLTRVRAGPTCARVFADFGADVIKVETPVEIDPNSNMAGPRHGYDMQNLHRNKRSLTLNLKSAGGMAVLKKLLADADVMIENFRPDVKDRLGLSWEALHALNPRLVLVSLSGFGQDGPYRTRAGFDQIAQGMGGLMSVTGLPGHGPVRAGIAVADSAAGLNGAMGALIALYERERTGLGQWVQTSLLEAMIGLMDFQAARFLVEGSVPPQAGNEHPYMTPMGVYATSDGHINIAAGNEPQWQALCKVLGLTDLGANADYDTVEKRFARRPALRRALEAALAGGTSAQWLAALEEAHVPAGPIYTMDEVFDDPQVQHLGIARAVPHPALGDIRVVGQAVTLSRTPADVVTPTPEAGAHNTEILKDLGYDDAAIAALRAEGAIGA